MRPTRPVIDRFGCARLTSFAVHPAGCDRTRSPVPVDRIWGKRRGAFPVAARGGYLASRFLHCRG